MGAGIALIPTLTVGLAQEKTGLAESLVGRYEHVPPQNDWHKVTIEFGTEGNLPWKNAAGRFWPLMIGDGAKPRSAGTAGSGICPTIKAVSGKGPLVFDVLAAVCYRDGVMKTACSLAGHGVLLAVLGIGLSSCSLLDVQSAAKQDYITPLTPALLGERAVPAPAPALSTEKASKKEGPESYRLFLNIIRVPFIPIGAAAELLFGGLSRTVI